jgi:hypothetical protein
MTIHPFHQLSLAKWHEICGIAGAEIFALVVDEGLDDSLGQGVSGVDAAHVVNNS